MTQEKPDASIILLLKTERSNYGNCRKGLFEAKFQIFRNQNHIKTENQGELARKKDWTYSIEAVDGEKCYREASPLHPMHFQFGMRMVSVASDSASLSCLLTVHMDTQRLGYGISRSIGGLG